MHSETILPSLHLPTQDLVYHFGHVAKLKQLGQTAEPEKMNRENYPRQAPKQNHLDKKRECSGQFCT